MPDDNWQNVREIFDVALGHKPEERQNYIVKACGSDKTLLAEVESLLASLDSSESFMETPAVARVAEAIGGNGKLLEKGHSLGHYEIIEPIGSGGMGEVYLARDQMLNRQVAVKILNDKFSRDESNLSRFIREAQAASALNHPNILVIHEIGEAEGSNYIVSEYVEGKTLRTICKEKPLQLSEILDVSIQIAGALSTAHKAHLIHRDIKPENIMIRPDGYVKILDFGLAKLIEEKNRSFLGLEESTAIQNPTAKGVIMGTVNYMSPEQAKGEDVDERTDIFSFGVVIYEMIAGTTPFAGDSMSETFANLINAKPPPLSRFSTNVPSELQRIVAKMLRKKKDDRYQTMKGLLADLKDLRDNLTYDERLERTAPAEGENPTIALQATTAEAKQQTADTQNAISSNVGLRRKLIFGFAAVGVITLASLAFFGYRYLNPPRLVNTVFKNMTIEKLPISGKLHSVAISPDEKYLAYVKGEPSGKMHLFLRQQITGSEKEIQTTQDSSLTLNGFSSDGNYFYFTSVGGNLVGALYQVPILGGEPKKIVNDIDSGPSFFPNGKEFVFMRHVFGPERDTFVLFNIESGEERVIYEADGTFIFDPQVSPDGEKIAFFLFGRGNLCQLAWITKQGGEAQLIGHEQWAADSAHTRWLRDGSGLVVLGRSSDDENTKLNLVNFPSGDASDLTKDRNYYKNFALSSDSRTLATIQSSVTKGIWAFDIVAKTSKQIKENTAGQLTGPGVTPDGQIIYSRPDGKGNDDLWSINSDGTDDHLFLSLGKPSRLFWKPVWGNGIYFYVNLRLWKADLDGKNSRQLFEKDDMFERLVGATPDSKTLLFLQAKIDENSWSLKRLDTETGEISQLIEDKDVQVYYAALSPDGKKIIYEYSSKDILDKDEKNKIAIVDFDGSKISNPKILEKFPGFEAIKFTQDSKNLYLIKLDNRADLWQMNLNGGQIAKVTDFNLEMIYNFNMSVDGKNIYLMRGNTTDEIVLLKNVD